MLHSPTDFKAVVNFDLFLYLLNSEIVFVVFCELTEG